MHYSGSYKRCRHGNRHPYIPFGKVTLLQGDSGDGKSKLMLSLAALLSKGAPLPFSDDEERYEPVTIIYQITEDDADDTVVPRFNAAGGDGERLSAAQRFFFFR
ncbi:AAA family ATPase [Gemmiger formicilis]|uniref:AAA family ATPase n=1 Tax=Gemmiger formicilis TaxID=745368 RepID=UPI002079D595|nr:AAA family ATPase [Gemmiger formicilis]